MLYLGRCLQRVRPPSGRSCVRRGATRWTSRTSVRARLSRGTSSCEWSRRPRTAPPSSRASRERRRWSAGSQSRSRATPGRRRIRVRAGDAVAPPGGRRSRRWCHVRARCGGGRARRRVSRSTAGRRVCRPSVWGGAACRRRPRTARTRGRGRSLAERPAVTSPRTRRRHAARSSWRRTERPPPRRTRRRRETRRPTSPAAARPIRPSRCRHSTPPPSGCAPAPPGGWSRHRCGGRRPASDGGVPRSPRFRPRLASERSFRRHSSRWPRRHQEAIIAGVYHQQVLTVRGRPSPPGRLASPPAASRPTSASHRPSPLHSLLPSAVTQPVTCRPVTRRPVPHHSSFRRCHHHHPPWSASQRQPTTHQHVSTKSDFVPTSYSNVSAKHELHHQHALSENAKYTNIIFF